jgi:uncharacterized protein (TIGR03066 family)
MASALDHVLTRLRTLVSAEDAGQWSDGQLLERFANTRDADAFAALAHRHCAMVVNVCRRVLQNDADAEDASQATFLILARRAGSIRKKGSVANWLHGVAYRAANMLRRQTIRRRNRDKAAAPLANPDPITEVTWREVQTILDEEIQRLPEKFKGPVLLCFLEGKAHNEGAQELGCSLTTFRGRLERARELLRRALSRRGVTLSGALLATLLSQKAAAAAVSPVLTITIVRAVLAGESAVQGILSTQVLTLAQAVMQAMFWNKMKAGLAAIVLAMVLFGVGGFSLRGLIGSGNAQGEARAADAQAKDRQATGRGSEEKPKTKTDEEKLQGNWEVAEVVFDGKPVNGFEDTLAAFDKDRINLIGKNKNEGGREFSFKLDPARKPKAIDMTALNGELQGSTNHAIYQLHGDMLKLCWFNEPGNKTRPAELASKEGSKLLLMTLQRIMKEGNVPVKGGTGLLPAGPIDGSKLIGTWECAKVEGQAKPPQWHIEFLKKGKLRMTTKNPEGEFALNGTHTLKKDKLTLTVEKNGKTVDTQIYTIESLTDEALIYLDHGKKIEFKRAK